MYKYIFIDLDDTIWDFRSNARASLKEAYEELGVKQYFDDYEQFFSIYIDCNNRLWKQLEEGKITREYLMLERFSYPLRMVNIKNDQLAKEMNNLFIKLLPTKTKLIPFAVELLEYLHLKYPLTIVSNGPRDVQHKKINNTSIHHYFNHVVLSEDAKALKPNKQIFEYALDLNKATPKEAIMIGDTYHADIEGARNVGIDQIFFNYREHKLNENQLSTHTVSSLVEIMDIL